MQIMFDSIRITAEYVGIDGSRKKSEYYFTETLYEFRSTFLDGTLDACSTTNLIYTYQRKLFYELLERTKLIVKRYKNAKPKTYLYCIELCYNAKTTKVLVEDVMYNVDPLFYNIWNRLCNVTSNKVNYLKGTPIQDPEDMVFKPKDVTYAVYTNKPNKTTGDELFLAVDDKIYYKEYFDKKVNSHQIIKKIFKGIDGKIAKIQENCIGDIFFNGLEFTFVFLSEELQRILLIRKDQFDILASKILVGEGNPYYSNTLNFVANHSDIPTNVVYKYKNY